MTFEYNNEKHEALSKCAEQDQKPDLYQVIMHNDDFTPMEFVIDVLQRFFFMERKRAAATMLCAHTNGAAACGIFTKDVATTKIKEVIHYARSEEHPLICSMEAAI